MQQDTNTNKVILVFVIVLIGITGDTGSVMPLKAMILSS